MAEQTSHEEFHVGNGTVGTSSQKITALSLKAYKYVKVRADAGNGNDIYVGTSENVSASNGFILDAGEEVEIPIDFTDKVWVLGGAADQDYSWLAV